MPIFDQGYQHWSGKLSGHTWRWLTISRQGIRVSMKNIFLRLVVIVSWIPAAVLAFMLCLWGLLEQKSPLILPLMPLMDGLFSREMVSEPLHYRVQAWTLCYHTFLQVELYFSMVVVLLVGPGLISQDLRLNALPLYFSRPLRRIDYFAGKLGVIAWFLSLVIILPSLLAYLLGLLFSLDITIVRDTLPLLLAALAYGMIIVLSAGTLILALSSLSRNSRYVALFWVALWFVTTAIGNILNQVDTEQRRHKAYRQNAQRFQPLQHPPDRPLTLEEQRAQQLAWNEWSRRSQEEFFAEEMHASQTNWRLLISYTANLSRIGEHLVDTDTIRREMSRFQPANERDEYLVHYLGPQYPWLWSAGILAAFFGLSVCILNYRVRSLDRLK